jgi:hypothetical protein
MGRDRVDWDTTGRDMMRRRDTLLGGYRMGPCLFGTERYGTKTFRERIGLESGQNEIDLDIHH